ncbi:phosphohistidine phosphatase SixA [Candidatus Omnitrophota bacterium]
MKLYLVQHGEATSKDINPERPLTEKGREDASKTALFLKKSGITVDVIWHSTKLRAIETAQVFEKELTPTGGILQKEGLAPNDPTEGIFSEAEAESKDIMIVGHLPFIQKIAALVLLGSESSKIIRFNMGGVVCLKKSEEGFWQLVFEVIPDLL